MWIVAILLLEPFIHDLKRFKYESRSRHIGAASISGRFKVYPSSSFILYLFFVRILQKFPKEVGLSNSFKILRSQTWFRGIQSLRE